MKQKSHVALIIVYDVLVFFVQNYFYDLPLNNNESSVTDEDDGDEWVLQEFFKVVIRRRNGQSRCNSIQWFKFVTISDDDDESVNMLQYLMTMMMMMKVL